MTTARTDSKTAPARDAVGIVSSGGFGDFERDAVASAHYAAAERQSKLAADRRQWAQERGPIWQRYLAQAILCERRARQHRERARAIFATPNTDSATPRG